MNLKFHILNTNTLNGSILLQKNVISTLCDSFNLTFQSQNYQIVNFNSSLRINLATKL